MNANYSHFWNYFSCFIVKSPLDEFCRFYDVESPLSELCRLLFNDIYFMFISRIVRLVF